MILRIKKLFSIKEVANLRECCQIVPNVFVQGNLDHQVSETIMPRRGK
jgi:hypothetical protein